MPVHVVVSVCVSSSWWQRVIVVIPGHTHLQVKGDLPVSILLFYIYQESHESASEFL